MTTRMNEEVGRAWLAQHPDAIWEEGERDKTLRFDDQEMSLRVDEGDEPLETRIARALGEELRFSYRNVDFDVKSPHDLQPLADAFEAQGLSVMHCERMPDGGFSASFELCTEDTKDPSRCIVAFAKEVARLPEPARALWNGADERACDVGVHAGVHPYQLFLEIDRAALAAVDELDATVRLTIYAPYPAPL